MKISYVKGFEALKPYLEAGTFSVFKLTLVYYFDSNQFWCIWEYLDIL